jgi:PAS domain S-box-containing protein
MGQAAALSDTLRSEADDRFRALFEQSPISTMIYAPDGRPLRINAAFRRLWGLDLGDLPPGYCIFNDPQLAAANLLSLVEQAFAGTETALPAFRYDATSLAGGGRARWTEAFLAPIRAADGKVYEVVLTQFDVTARVEAAAALTQAEALARSQVEALTRTIGHLADSRDVDALSGHVLAEIARQSGAAIGHIFAYHPDDDTLSLHVTVRDGQIATTPWPDDPTIFGATFPATVTPVVAHLRATRRLGLLSADQFDGWAWPGTLAWHEAQGHQDAAVLGLLAGDQLVGVLGLAFYRTPQLTPADTQLIETLGQQAALALQLTNLAREARQVATLAERTRLAREIHDTLAQGFAGIIVQLQTAQELAAAPPAGQQRHLALALDLARASLAEARRSVGVLRETKVEARDLRTALHQLVQAQTAEATLVAALHMPAMLPALPAEAQHQLLRICQEAIINVRRHAQAQTLTLTVRADAGQLWVQIRDDGVGFDPESVAGAHYGLLGMRERAQQIGADLQVASTPGQGTTMTVSLALPEEAQR